MASPRSRSEIPTPALVLDLDFFERNVVAMADLARAYGKALRPHGKTHKCPEIARRLIAAGAVGVCAAKLGEAEAFAEAGVRGLLITTAVIGSRKIERAMRLAGLAPDTILCVDDPGNVRDLGEAASAASVVVNVAVDLYFGRTGILPGRPAVELAQHIDAHPRLRFAGLQAYDSSASHIHDFAERRARTTESMGRAVETKGLIERGGMACPFITGASTGTSAIDAAIEGVTELQPGSYVFMDLDYSRIGGPEGPPSRRFANALTVLTTVVSRQKSSAIVDGGFKAFATDRPFGPEPLDLPGVSYTWAGDEHGRLDLTHAPRDLQVGERIEFIPPHCDPTVNLYDHLYAVRGDVVEGIWPIAARGRSD